MSSHVVSPRKYALIFATLIACTILTTEVARIDLGPLNAVVALTIAVFKALLVALFFMHLMYTRHRTKIMAAAGILWLVILISLTLGDVLTRSWIPVSPGL